jgi:GNAT superfamily N-acetyltransferase
MTVLVREWDPAAAPADEIAATLRVLNLILATDVPEDPPWRITSFREYLAVTMPGERRICWLAEEGDETLGYASILLVGDIAVLELLVRPDARRAGVGSGLLAAAARRATAEAFGSIGVEVVGGTPAADFFEAQGFRCAFVEMRTVLDLSTVDWLQLGALAKGVGSGYRIEYHPGGPAERMFEEYAKAKASVRLNPAYDLELRPSSYDSERLQASVATLHARGLKPHVVLAVHEQSGQVAGLTEVVVPAQRPTRADQYDTIVVHTHRGYGLTRALKARMLFELRAAEPQLLDVQTWNGIGSEAMRRINDELGFTPNREWREYEGDADDVLRRLDAAPTSCG